MRIMRSSSSSYDFFYIYTVDVKKQKHEFHGFDNEHFVNSFLILNVLGQTILQKQGQSFEEFICEC